MGSRSGEEGLPPGLFSPGFSVLDPLHSTEGLRLETEELHSPGLPLLPGPRSSLEPEDTAKQSSCSAPPREKPQQDIQGGQCTGVDQRSTAAPRSVLEFTQLPELELPTPFHFSGSLFVRGGSWVNIPLLRSHFGKPDPLLLKDQ